MPGPPGTFFSKSCKLRDAAGVLHLPCSCFAGSLFNHFENINIINDSRTVGFQRNRRTNLETLRRDLQARLERNWWQSDCDADPRYLCIGKYWIIL
jgi:hypothetical protein